MEMHSLPVTRRRALGLAGAVGLAGCSGIGTSNGNGIGAAGEAGAAGGTAAAQQGSAQQGETVRAYVGSYHWGYVLLDEDGSELDQLTLSPGDELRLTLFNVEADGAVESLPRRVRANVPDGDERARRNEQRIQVPPGASLETLHEAAEAVYPDHSLATVSDAFVGGGSGSRGPRGPSGGGGGGPGSGPSGGPGGGWGPWGGHHGPHGWGGGPGGPGGQFGPGMGMHGGGFMSGFGPGMMGMGYGWTLAPTVFLWHHSTVPSELGFVVNTTGSFGFACTVYCGYGHPYMYEPERIVVSD